MNIHHFQSRLFTVEYTLNLGITKYSSYVFESVKIIICDYENIDVDILFMTVP